ncbi:ABC transporter ATP-binding protein [Rickettsia prowazekii str. Rp22]|uniref:ABC transporter ATP-binding protein n=1 Tax=Rickettsia prowazekii (strain Rp22) TaxID=449216 RepID=D5AWN5_RICPP|nr:ABC transporter ATP-binding protein [Rickettsia prowazekii str. Rp22]AGJ02531.1 ABC transporter ATP-binding protein [Rickettsia prowazekii str. Breinl]EOB09665.1 Histidine--tRNA ligase [Rickettsia prowazekii str. GvF12]EOB10423.1 ABC transporter ATP-binding protein [Rickettsia prowazekii str. Cairo 3]
MTYDNDFIKSISTRIIALTNRKNIVDFKVQYDDLFKKYINDY